MLVRTIGALGIVLGLGVASCGSDEEGGSSGSGGGAGTAAGTAGKAAAGNAGKGGATGSAGKGGGAGGDGSGGQSGGGGGAGGAGAGEGGMAGADRGGEAGQGGENAAGSAGRGDEGGGAAGAAGEGGATAGNNGDSGDSGAGGEAGSGDPVLPITVFDGGTGNGGIEYSGRLGLDAVCESAKEALALAGVSPRALISVGPADQIADFPSLYGLPIDRPFAGPGGAIIASDFADLLDGSIDLSLEQAGVITSEPGFWFTGSEPDGTASANDCAGWTFSELDQTIRANYGHTYDTDSWWLGGNATASCGAGQYHIVCVTW